MRSQQQPQTPSEAQTLHRLSRGLRYDPYEHADVLGLQVLTRPIRRDELVLPPKYRTIVIRSGLREVHRRNALAHGIAHWELGHPDDRPKFEAAADRYASLYLIDPVEFEYAARFSSEPGAIADELGVTRRLLDAYLGRRAS